MKLKKAGGETAGLLATVANVSTHPSCLTQEMEKGQDAVCFRVRFRSTISSVYSWVIILYDVYLGGHHAKQIRGFSLRFFSPLARIYFRLFAFILLEFRLPT